MGNESDTVGTKRFVVHVGSDPVLASQPADDFVAAVEQRSAHDDFVQLVDAKPRRRRRRRRFGPVGVIAILVIVVGIAMLSFSESRQWIGIAPSVETPAPTIAAIEPVSTQAEVPSAGTADPDAAVTAPPSEAAATQGVWQTGSFRESETGSTVRYILPPGTPPVPNVKPDAGI